MFFFRVTCHQHTCECEDKWTNVEKVNGTNFVELSSSRIVQCHNAQRENAKRVYERKLKALPGGFNTSASWTATDRRGSEESEILPG